MAVRVRFTLTEARLVKFALEDHMIQERTRLAYAMQRIDYNNNPKRPLAQSKVKSRLARLGRIDRGYSELVKEIRLAEQKAAAAWVRKKNKHSG